MNFDNSWNALLNPGKAAKYFDLHSGKPFEATATSYSKINAWWLAEFSRLIYKDDAVGPGKRQDFLDKVGLQEHFIESPPHAQADTQCAIIKPSQTDKPPFAVLVFRGTSNLRDWLTNLRELPVEWEKGGQVYDGFMHALNSVWDPVEAALDQLNCPLFYTGHSLGAALATLAASRRPPQGLYTFGSPFVGDKQFALTLPGQGMFRVANNRDIVATLPLDLADFGQVHVGELHYIAHDGQMLLNPADDQVAKDRLQRDTMNSPSSNLLRHFIEPAEFLADHAPVNYVAHLERAI